MASFLLAVSRLSRTSPKIDNTSRHTADRSASHTYYQLSGLPVQAIWSIRAATPSIPRQAIPSSDLVKRPRQSSTCIWKPSPSSASSAELFIMLFSNFLSKSRSLSPYRDSGSWNSLSWQFSSTNMPSRSFPFPSSQQSTYLSQLGM